VARLVAAAGVLAVIAALLVPSGGAGASVHSRCDFVSRMITHCVVPTPTPTPTPTTSTPAPPPTGHVTGSSAPTCGGEVVAGRTCTFDDEFSGTSLDRSAWTVETTDTYNFHSGPECIEDSPANESVSGGNLNLTVLRSPTPVTCGTGRYRFTADYTAGGVFTGAFSQEYGRFEIRAKFPEANGIGGLQSALWLFPTSQTVNNYISGVKEIDIAEAFSNYPDLVNATVHSTAGAPGGQRACTMPDYGAAFHTYVAEWSASSITITYDGVTCLNIVAPIGVHLSADPFLVALTQPLGMGGRNGVSAATPLPATMQVDYVRVWQ
jgi:beta-glucanase (GH16 family)